MTDRTVSVKLRADVEQFKKSMSDAGQSVDKTTQKTSQQITNQKQAVGELSKTVAIAGGAMTALAVVAVKKFADFDQSMSNVAATGSEAKASIDALRTAAIDAGKATVYSATEAAGAEESLAKAGLSAKQILGGGLTGALNLAAAGALNVADAADITSVALNQFKLGGDKASHVADLLAAGAGKAMGDVSDLGMALKQGGLVAAQTGLSIEETTGALAAFASQGLLGSDAGTSFKTMLQRLTPQSVEAQKQFDKLGISAYDAQGNFVGLANFAGQLHDKMSSLTPEARNAALSVMFGSDAVRAASVLYSEGAQGIQDWTSAVDDSGYAANVASTRLDNLKGDWEQLSGSVETALINMGEGANGPLRSLTQTATNVVNAFADAPPAVQGLALAITGGGGLVALGAAGLGKLVVGVSEVKDAMAALNISTKITGIAVGAMGGALGIATVAMGIWSDAQSLAAERVASLRNSLDAASGSATNNTRAVIANDLAVRHGWWIFKADSVADSAKKIGLSMNDITDAILGNADAMAKVKSATSSNWINANGQDILADQLNVQKQVAQLSDKYKEAVQNQRDAASVTGATANATAANTSALEQYTKAQEAGKASTEQYTDALAELVDGQNKAAGVVLSLRDAQRAYEAAIDDAAAALKENGTTLDITTEKGRANQAALDDVAKSGWDLIASMQANGASAADLQAKMASIRDTFIKVAESEGMSAGQANELATKLGLLPSNVNVDVAVNTNAAKKAIDQFLAGYQNAQVRVAVVGGSGGITRAEGGPVYGPGTSTSDSIPALLSNGEYVVKAAAVNQVGTKFLDDLNAQRFATGGIVGGGPYSAPSPEFRTLQVTQQITTTDPIGAATAAIRRLNTLAV